MTDLLEDFADFLTHSPTSWHAVEEMGNRLASVDFTPLPFGSKWQLKKGGRYFVIHDGSLAAFILPERPPERMAIVTAHTDSPALKLKPSPLYQKHNMDLLAVEVYGSPILPTWINRDLAISGKVVVQKKSGEIEEHTTFLDDAPLLIAALAPHLDRQAHKKGMQLNPQDHLIPIIGLTQEGLDPLVIEDLLRRHLCFEKLLDFDLYLVPLEKPRFIGKASELLASYRLDNLASCHSALTAIASAKSPSATLPITLFWDHEEVGSQTSTGACSPFFHDLYRRICALYSIQTEEEILLRQNSLCLSADLAHAINPAYEKRYDPRHLPLLGGGIVLKYNANMRYTTSARTGALVSSLCSALHLQLQRFVNRSDTPTGSTVGPPFASQMGIETADIGIAQLAMHASREVIACRDHLDMCSFLTAFMTEDI